MHEKDSSIQLDFKSEDDVSQPQTERYGVSITQPAISFGPDERDPIRRGRISFKNRRSISRSRSRSHARSASNLPIEFRRMSFQISESETREKLEADLKGPRKEKQEIPEDSHYFEGLDFHRQTV